MTYIYKDNKYYKETLVEVDSNEILKLLNSNVGNSDNSLDLIPLKVNYIGWKSKTDNRGTKYKTNKSEDIFEIEIDGVKEQLFTQQSAIREAEKQGLRLPTIEEWGKIIKDINPNININLGWQDNDSTPSIKEKLNIDKLAGYSYPNGIFSSQGDYACFWSSTTGRNVEFDKSQVCPIGDYSPEYAFSALCLKN